MRRLLPITVLLLYTALLAYLSLARVEQPDLGVRQADKIYHALGYTVLALLLLNSRKRESGAWYPFLAAAAFGLLIEVIQYFIPYRSASLFDGAANAAGAFAGAYGGAWLLGRFGGTTPGRRKMAG